MSEGTLFVISGPSGAGKGTLVNAVLEANPSIRLSTSATTRAPREGEVNGEHYYFMSVDEFKENIEKGDFIEWALVHSNYYGTPLAPIQEHLKAGESVILEIDVKGAFQVRNKLPETKLVFIKPPSLDVLEERLRGRGTETEEVIQHRLSNAVGEIDASKEYDVIIVNDDLKEATKELLSVLES